MSWLEEGAFSTPIQVSRRLGVGEDTVRAWAQAGVLRYIADGRPVRYLLCDDDVDDLANLLRGVGRPSLPLIRVLLAARESVNDQPRSAPQPEPNPRTTW